MEEPLVELADIIKGLDSISSFNHNSRTGISHQRTQKLRVIHTDNELHQILYLVDCHVPTLREKAAMRYEKLLNTEDQNSKLQLQMLKDIITPKCSWSLKNEASELKRIIAELPKEWTAVQLTTQFDPKDQENLDLKVYQTKGLYLTLFNCGQDAVDPLLITLDPPRLNGAKLDLLQLLMNALDKNSARLFSTSNKKFFKNRNAKKLYILQAEEVELTVANVIQDAEKHWLRLWRCLLLGKLQDQLAEQTIWNNLQEIFKILLKGVTVNKKHKQLLFYILKGASFLTQEEIFEGVKYCLGNVCNEGTLKNVAHMVKEKNLQFHIDNSDLLRHPVILIIDETLDSIPWEMMDVLKNESVSRVPSLHFLYFLYKIHEKDIENGQKIISNYTNGNFIVNPDVNLDSMEVRMMSFYKYWLPKWGGMNGRKPTNEEFFELLKSSDIFAYSGHGNGSHIMTVEMLQKIHVKGVVLLFGCASSRITRLGPQTETYGAYHMYLMSRCPTVVGMLWPVTDVSMDLLTTEFISNWVPSAAPIAWTNVEKEPWIRGGGSFVAVEKPTKVQNNLELLRAISYCKRNTSHYMTKAACVVRGLPIKIKPT
ncbi:uncharacterized protein Sse [Euwallacea similis]|uniref:uncharacterized protein Sse n=1 Tax=Euwallacea similis TaxID=1736056 RepID=UPI0034506805